MHVDPGIQYYGLHLSIDLLIDVANPYISITGIINLNFLNIYNYI